MHPLMPMCGENVAPYHSTQYAALPRIYVQNASLEIAWSRIALENGVIAGEVITPFLTQDDEGLDINSPDDWQLLEVMLAEGSASLPKIDREPFTAEADIYATEKQSWAI